MEGGEGPGSHCPTAAQLTTGLTTLGAPTHRGRQLVFRSGTSCGFLCDGERTGNFVFSLQGGSLRTSFKIPCGLWGTDQVL